MGGGEKFVRLAAEEKGEVWERSCAQPDLRNEGSKQYFHDMQYLGLGEICSDNKQMKGKSMLFSRNHNP